VIRDATVEDLQIMVHIYNQAIEDKGSANCDVHQDRIDGFEATYFPAQGGGPVLVSTTSDGRDITGWGAIKPFSARPHEPGLGEIAVYIQRQQRGAGHGVQLLQSLLEAAKEQGWHALVAVILGRNIASLRGCLACGFEEVVRLPAIAQVNDRQEDIVWMHKFINNRQGTAS
jgi:phosphinothricin acetyltransferase